MHDDRPRTTPDSAEPAHGHEEPQADTGRRRFLLTGLAPFALTLASRPVLAGSCKSPSAWGSELLNPNTSIDHPSLAYETWTITNWLDNTSRANLGRPWNRLLGSQASSNSYYKNYKVSTLFSSLNIPPGLAGSDKVWSKLNTGTSFQKYMLVARLNCKLLAPVQQCLNNNGVDQLNLMARGYYQPQNIPDLYWDQADIRDYLYNNWIVRP